MESGHRNTPEIQKALKVFLDDVNKVSDKQLYSFDKVNNNASGKIKSSYMGGQLIRMIVGNFQHTNTKDLKIKLSLDPRSYIIKVDPLEFEMVLQGLLAEVIELSNRNGIILVSSLFTDEKCMIAIEINDAPVSVKSISEFLEHLDRDEHDILRHRLESDDKPDSDPSKHLDEKITIEEQPGSGLKLYYSLPAKFAGTPGEEPKDFIEMTIDTSSERKAELPPEWDRHDFQKNLALSKMYTYIKEHAHHHDLNVELLASACNKSRRNLYRFIKTELDMTPADMIREIRMEKAFDLLKNDPDLSIDEVAFKVGYQKTTWFKKVFTERYGIPPDQVR